jgi:hypothetical protein
MYWQDIPAKSGREYNILPSGATNVPVTADDVAFSVAYIAASSDAWNWGLVKHVVYCDIKDPYTVTVYYGLLMPLWAAHEVGGLPIMPKEVWGSVPFADAGTYDALGQETLIGSGPFQWNYSAYIEGQYVRLDKFESGSPDYQFLTPIDAYVTADGIRVNPSTEVNYTVHLDSRDTEYTITGDLVVKVDGVTVNTQNGLVLAPKQTTTPYSGSTVALARGPHNVTVEFTITGSPDWMIDMKKTYAFHILSTIREDINLDYWVNSKDADLLDKALSSKPGDVNWDSRCDINGDGYVNAKDANLLGKRMPWPWAEDIAVTNVTTSKTVVGQGYPLGINVTVQNNGGAEAGFNVTVYTNTTQIASQIVTLSSGYSTVISFTWNTTGFVKGNYTIWAYTWPVPGETDTANNNFTDGTVYVGIPGDINYDTYVNAKDAVLLGKAFNSNTGQPTFDPNADLNDDDWVNAKDAIILGKHFNEHDP